MNTDMTEVKKVSSVLKKMPMHIVEAIMRELDSKDIQKLYKEMRLIKKQPIEEFENICRDFYEKIITEIH